MIEVGQSVVHTDERADCPRVHWVVMTAWSRRARSAGRCSLCCVTALAALLGACGARSGLDSERAPSPEPVVAVPGTAAGTDAPPPEPSWRFLMLDPIPGVGRTEYKALSGDGTVAVGEALFASDAGERVGPIVWTYPEGSRELVPAPEQNAPLVCVSSDGSRRGGMTTARGSYQPYLWRDGDIEFVPIVGSLDAMSDSAQWVVGRYLWVPDYIHAYRWSAATGRVDLGTLPDEPNSSALAVTNDGSVVVGNSGERAFRWTERLGMVELPPPAGKSRAHAVDVSDDGIWVVGRAGTYENDVWSVTLWRDGVPEELPPLVAGSHSEPYAMTNDGSVIVGESGEAVLWSKAHGVQSISQQLSERGVDTAGWTLTRALDVSNDGSVVLGEAERGADSSNESNNERGWWVARL